MAQLAEHPPTRGTAAGSRPPRSDDHCRLRRALRPGEQGGDPRALGTARAAAALSGPAQRLDDLRRGLGGRPGSGGFSYIAGAGLEPGAVPPDGMDTLVFPPAPTRCFASRSTAAPLHPQVKAAMAAIWGEILPASGLTVTEGPDFEAYDGRFSPDRPGAIIDFHVPVRGVGGQGSAPWRHLVPIAVVEDVVVAEIVHLERLAGLRIVARHAQAACRAARRHGRMGRPRNCFPAARDRPPAGCGNSLRPSSAERLHAGARPREGPAASAVRSPGFWPRCCGNSPCLAA